jgi:DNA recombination protein RmuC
MEFIYLITGLLLGGLLGWLYFKNKLHSNKGTCLEESEKLKGEINQVNLLKSRFEERNLLLQQTINSIQEEILKEREKNLTLNSDYASLNADHQNLKLKLEENKKEMNELQQKFSAEFKNIANSILEEKSKIFTEQNRVNIEGILKPLNEKIKDFEKKVEDTYDKESKQRYSLEREIKSLYDLNIQITKEASNLTNALKGQSKTMGNWGEVILESILEKSGLIKDSEYFVQESITDEEGKRYQPDIIIQLPENKCMIIDSKVSLVSYERYCSAEEETEKAQALKNHILSVRNHIKNLGSKSYQNLNELETLDFVLMFMPIEPAFSLAVQHDISLFNEALERNIVLVTPSTLLATLKTIASIWRQEKQNKNALEIARQGGALYDKFEGLLKDLIELGNKLKGTQKSYEDSMKKLYSGTGNLIKRAEDIKKLGAKATKSLPQSLVDRIDETDQPAASGPLQFEEETAEMDANV